MKCRRTVSVLAILALAWTIGGVVPPEMMSRASTVVQELKQVDAVYGSLNGGEVAHYVMISWKGSADYYAVYQVIPGDPEREERLQVIAATEEMAGQFTVAIRFASATTASFRVYECDEKGDKLSEDDPGARLDDVKTLPGKQQKPKLSYWYRSSNRVDLRIDSDGYSEGYQVRVEGAKGKKFTTKNVNGSAVSGSAALAVSLKPSYRGRVVHVKVRGYVNVGGVKKYGSWSDPYVYASSKKLKLSGYKDAITVSGLKVKNAKKKAIYISKKKNKGFKLAKKVGSKTGTVKVSQYGKKYVHSDRTYYVRVYYYYKLNGKLKKSEVYDQGKVYIKPTYFNLPVGY